MKKDRDHPGMDHLLLVLRTQLVQLWEQRILKEKPRRLVGKDCVQLVVLLAYSVEAATRKVPDQICGRPALITCLCPTEQDFNFNVSESGCGLRLEVVLCSASLRLKLQQVMKVSLSLPKTLKLNFGSEI